MAHSDDTGGAPDTEQLYNDCKQAETLLHKLATGLGQVGAGTDAVQAVSQMAEVVGKICNGLAKGMKASPAEPPHTVHSATESMMADHAARQAPPPGPPA